MDKYERPILIILVILLIFVSFMLFKKNEELNQLMRTINFRVLETWNFETMNYLFEDTIDQPNRNNLEALFWELLNKDRQINTLFLLSSSEIQDNLDESFIKYRNQLDGTGYMAQFILKLSYKEEIDVKDIENIKGVMNSWKNFIDSAEKYVRYNGGYYEVNYPNQLMVHYLELIKEVEKINSTYNEL